MLLSLRFVKHFTLRALGATTIVFIRIVIYNAVKTKGSVGNLRIDADKKSDNNVTALKSLSFPQCFAIVSKSRSLLRGSRQHAAKINRVRITNNIVEYDIIQAYQSSKNNDVPKISPMVTALKNERDI